MIDRRVRPIKLKLQILILYNLSSSISETETSDY